MPPLAISVYEPITKIPLVIASVLVTVVVPPKFNVPPLMVNALNVAVPLKLKVPELIIRLLNILVALPIFMALVPDFVIPPAPLIIPETLKIVLIFNTPKEEKSIVFSDACNQQWVCFTQTHSSSSIYN